MEIVTNSTGVMQAPAKVKFDDRAQLADLLSSQKYITSSYNVYLNECETTAVKNCFANILNDEHTIQNEIFCDMKTRGWYEPPMAEDAKVKKATEKFGKDVSR